MCRAALMALSRELSTELSIDRCLSTDRERRVLLLALLRPLTPDDVSVLLLEGMRRGEEYNLWRG